MGLRFRKSVKIAPGVRLNISKKSVGISAGVKGYRKSINSSGRVTTSIGVPGTGVSYVKTENLKSKKKKAVSSRVSSTAAAASSSASSPAASPAPAKVQKAAALLRVLPHSLSVNQLPVPSFPKTKRNGTKQCRRRENGRRASPAHQHHRRKCSRNPNPG